jgi:6-phosphogluconolactonase
MADTPVKTFVYVSHADGHDLWSFRLDSESGRLTKFDEQVIPGPEPPSFISVPLAQSPDRRFLYAALRKKPHAVASYRIDPTTGRLTHLGNAPLRGTICYIAPDHTGRFLLAASYQHTLFSVSPIDDSGVVQEPMKVIEAGGNAHCIRPDPSNRFVFVSNLSLDVVMQQRFDAETGTLTENDPPTASAPAKAGPRHFDYHPNGRFVFLLNETAASICTFAFNAEAGTLTLRDTVSALPGDIGEQPFAADIHLTPDGRFLYASVRKSSTLAAFAVDGETGKLTLIAHYPTEEQPRAFNIDPSGRFLIASGQLSHGLTVYRIDANTGTLTPLERYPVAKNPGWVEIVPLR